MSIISFRGTLQIESSKITQAIKLLGKVSKAHGDGEEIWKRDGDVLSVMFEAVVDEAAYWDLENDLFDLSRWVVSGHLDVKRPWGVVRFFGAELFEYGDTELPENAIRLGSRAFMHSLPVSSVAWSPDGSRVATGASNGFAGAVSAWDGEGNKLFQVPAAQAQGQNYDHLGANARVGFVNGGEFVLSGGMGDFLRLWNAETGALVASKKVAKAFDMGMNTVAGLAAVIIAREVLVFDTSSLAQTGTFALKHFVYSVDVDDDGRVIVRDSKDKITVWDGTKAVTWKGREKWSHVAAGRRIVAAQQGKESDRVVVVTSAGEEVFGITVHAGKVGALAWSDDGEHVFVGASDAVVKWHPESGEEVAYVHPYGRATQLAVSPAGDALLMCVGGNGIHRLDLERGEWDAGGYDGIATLDASVDGRRLLVGAISPVLFDAASLKPLQTYVASQESSLSADGNVVALVRDYKLEFQSAEDGAVLYRHKGKGDVYQVRFMPDGEHYLIRSTQPTALRTLKDHKKVATLGGDWSSLIVASAGGQVVAVVEDEVMIRVFSLPGAKLLGEVEASEKPTAVALSFDGRRLAYSTGESITFVALNKGLKVLWTLEGKWTSALALGVDGKRLVAAQSAGLTVIDTDNGQIEAHHGAHRQVVQALVALVDGRIVAGAADGSVTVWTGFSEPASGVEIPRADADTLAVLEESLKAREKESKKVAEAKARIEEPGTIDAFAGAAGSPLHARTQSLEEASTPPRVEPGRLTARGAFYFADLAILQAALRDFESQAYVEYYSDEDWTVEGLKATIDLDVEMAADCLAFQESFDRMSLYAAAGDVQVWELGMKSGLRYLGAGLGVPVLPEVAPGAVGRYGRGFTRPVRSGRWEVDGALVGDFWDSMNSRYLLASIDMASGQLLAQRDRGSDPETSILGTTSYVAEVAPKNIRILDRTLALVREIRPTMNADRVWCSPAGRYLAIGSNDDGLQLWDVEGGTCLATYGGFFSSVAFMGEEFVVLEGELAGAPKPKSRKKGQVHVINFITDERDTVVLPEPYGTVVAGARAGRFAYFANSQVFVVDARGSVLNSSPTMKYVAEARVDGDILRARSYEGLELTWDLESGVATSGHSSPVLAATFVGEDLIASLDDAGELIVFRRGSGEIKLRGRWPVRAPRRARLQGSTDGRRLVVCGGAGVLVVDLDQPQWPVFKAAITGAFIEDGRLVLGHKKGELSVWSRDLEEESRHVISDEDVHFIEAASKLKVRATTAGGSVMLVDLADPGAVMPDEARDGVAVGDGLLLRARESFVDVIGANGAVMGSLQGHAAAVTSIDVHGGRILSTGHDGTIVEWSVAALETLGWR